MCSGLLFFSADSFFFFFASSFDRGPAGYVYLPAKFPSLPSQLFFHAIVRVRLRPWPPPFDAIARSSPLTLPFFSRCRQFLSYELCRLSRLSSALDLGPPLLRSGRPAFPSRQIIDQAANFVMNPSPLTNPLRFSTSAAAVSAKARLTLPSPTSPPPTSPSKPL